MLLDEPQSLADLALAQSEVPRNFDLWLHPELGLALGSDCMNVKPRFLTREEEEPKTGRSEDRRTHEKSVAPARTPAARIMS